MDDPQNKDSLKNRVIRGSIWLGAGSGVEHLFRFLRNIILTRILLPEVFGEMAIILAINAIFESFTEIGIKNAIIQSPKGEEQEYLNGAWWLSVVRSLILYSIAFVGAPYLAKFYQSPGLTPLMRVAFLTIIFNGFISSKAYVAVKRLQFKPWIMFYQGGSILGLTVTVTLALVTRNIWALIIGFTVEAAARCLLSYVVCPFKPGMRFDRESLRSLFKYARGMIGLPIFTFIFLRADIFVIGKLLPFSLLGLYAMATALARMPVLFGASIANRIMMPMFAEIQTEKDKINDALLKITYMIAILGFPLLLFAIFYGKDVLTIVYGSEYGRVSVPFAIIFALEFFRMSSIPLVAVYLATGRPELHRLFAVVRACLMVVFIVPAVKWFGLTGAASAGLAAMIISYFLQADRMRRLTGINLWKYGIIFFQAAGISLFVFLCWIATYKFFPDQPVIRMVPGALGCLLAYGTGLGFFFHMRKSLQYS